ncbi:32761_t:CDS:2, partial [Gigaspora margarita]
KSPQQWIALSTLVRWNKEVAALSFSQNCPKENSSRFFGYGIMVDETNQKVTLPPGNRAHEMPNKMVIWIKDLQDCSDNIYELFGEELADTGHELNTTDFENLCELLHDGVENALNGFIKWMETWVHLPLCICRI